MKNVLLVNLTFHINMNPLQKNFHVESTASRKDLKTPNLVNSIKCSKVVNCKHFILDAPTRHDLIKMAIPPNSRM